MLTISKPLSAAQAQNYHREEFKNARENYYTEGEVIQGQWHGQLANEWGLRGAVDEQQFARLSQGQHPVTGEQLVRHQVPREYEAADGHKVRSMEHRAGWDATFSAPKSVSLTALVGGDDEVRQAHRESVQVALNELEKYVQARIGGNHPSEPTGKWVAATFEHDSARPVDGYAAPQLHTHVLIFNLTEREDGETRAIQPHDLYRSQQYATAVYRSELAVRLTQLGYEVEAGKSGQPEIKGYTQEYIEASSPRRQQIKAHMKEAGVEGARAAQIAAHQTREPKQDISHDAMQQRHRDLAEQFGNQPQRVIEDAHFQRTQAIHEHRDVNVDYALDYSRDRNLERQAVADERDLLRDTLKRSMGEATLKEVQERFARRIQTGEFVEVGRYESFGGRAYTTPETIDRERDTIAIMQGGQGKHQELVTFATRHEATGDHAYLSAAQRHAVEEVLTSHDQVFALEGTAGAGKTTSLNVIREAAEREGYIVEGFAPTTRAAHELEQAGVNATTIQHYLVHDLPADAGSRHLYIVDEASLASSKQVNELLHRAGEDDRILFVGDSRQHEAVEAGRPYYQLQHAGMHTAHLDDVVRQHDPALREVVEQLARGEVRDAIDNLEQQGRVHEITSRHERLAAIAHDYVSNPSGALVIAPDNYTRSELNALIHHEMQAQGHIGTDEHNVVVLTPRQELTAADLKWAGQYETGDVVRYAKGSRQLGIEPGEYARVTQVDGTENLITVERSDGERQRYSPDDVSGVAVYRESVRQLSEGDRVQFTAPSNELHVANRELGTIEDVGPIGDVTVRTDSGSTVAFNTHEYPHLDYGYAVTSHSSQGQTADRVLIHVDTEQGAHLVNSRMAYVAISRGRDDVQIYTDDRTELADYLSRSVDKRTALDEEQVYEDDPRSAAPPIEHVQGQEISM